MLGDLVPFAVTTLLVAVAVLAAVGSSRLADRIRVPTPALFLIAAALASDLVPRLGDVSIVVDQRIVTVALVLILFHGGMHIGWERMRPAAGAVVWSAPLQMHARRSSGHSRKRRRFSFCRISTLAETLRSRWAFRSVRWWCGIPIRSMVA